MASSDPAIHPVTNELILSLLHEGGVADGNVHDLGAGSGYFSRRLVEDWRRRKVVGGAVATRLRRLG